MQSQSQSRRRHWKPTSLSREFYLEAAERTDLGITFYVSDEGEQIMQVKEYASEERHREWAEAGMYAEMAIKWDCTRIIFHSPKRRTSQHEAQQK